MRIWEIKLKWLCLNSCLEQRKNQKSPAHPICNSDRFRLAPVFKQRQTNWQKHKTNTSPWLAFLALWYQKLMLAAVLLQGPQVVTPARITAPRESLCTGTAAPSTIARVHQPGSPSLPCSFHPAWYLLTVVLTWFTAGMRQFHTREFLLSCGVSLCQRAREEPETQWAQEKPWPDCCAEMLTRHRGKAIAAS